MLRGPLKKNKGKKKEIFDENALLDNFLAQLLINQIRHSMQ
jgi:hypothetical protein